MYLKRLEIQGFKSFARHTALDFLPPRDGRYSIIGIVGPNGAGKSNIVDALRWVMGETSLKTIRGKKGEDVIFHGSPQKGAGGMAEVTMVLDNSDRASRSRAAPGALTASAADSAALTALLGEPEITLARRFYRSGESEFLINDRPVKLLDVHLLLARLQFAEHAYSIVGQGMIDRLLTVGPGERKDWFDEACGIKEWQIKEHQATLKLARTRENMAQATALLAEVTPRLRLLSRQVKKLAERQEIEQQLGAAQNSYYRTLYWRIQAEQQQWQRAQEQWESEYRPAAAALAQAQQELGELGKGASRQQLFAALTERYRAAQAAEHEAERQLTVLGSQLQSVYREQGAGEVGWLTRKIAEQEAKLPVLARARGVTEAALAAADKLRQEAEARAKKLQSESAELTLAGGRAGERGALGERSAGAVWQWSGADAAVAFAEAEQRFGAAHHLLATRLAPGSDRYRIRIWGETPAIAERLADLPPAAAVEFSATGIMLGAAGAESESAAAARRRAAVLAQEIAAAKAPAVEAQGRAAALQRELTAAQAAERALDNELAELKRELSLASAAPAEFDARRQALSAEQPKLQAQLAACRAASSRLAQELADFNRAEEDKQKRIFALQARLQERQAAVTALEARRREIAVAAAKVETRQEDLAREVQHELKATLASLVQREGDTVSPAAALSELSNIIEKLKYQLTLIGGIDAEVVAEYEVARERQEFLSRQLSDLAAAVADLERLVTELNALMKQKRAAAFKQIRQEFKRYFQILFDGGRADLEEVYGEAAADEAGGVEVVSEAAPISSAPLLSGIEVIAQPPGKKVKYLAQLSGGERTLTSLALICAILHVNPSPFVVLDEVEAALDEANTLRLVRILRELTTRSQFIIITHNRVTMHAAAALYGVVLGREGSSELLSVKLEDVGQYE
ncbi:MAG: AAA family ATPase [Candidatus Magasanikbacteria bacterium]|nr:AAA family ATPase [Candidatus Magasanikbacteria bacterium]